MRNTLFNLAESLYEDVSFGTAQVTRSSDGSHGRLRSDAGKRNHQVLEDEDDNQEPPDRNEVYEEIQDSPHPMKRKRNTKSVKGNLSKMQC